MEPVARVEPAARKGKGKNIDQTEAAAEAQEKCHPSSDPREERTLERGTWNPRQEWNL
jgi:hypothetical protein